MFEMVMLQCLATLVGRAGNWSIRYPGPDRHSIVTNGYAIKACPVPMHSMRAIGGFDACI